MFVSLHCFLVIQESGARINPTVIPCRDMIWIDIRQV